MLSDVFAGMTGGSFKTLTLLDPRERTPSRASKARFAWKAAAGQVSGEYRCLVFDHAGPATIQAFVPSALRKPYAIFLHSVEVWNGVSPACLRALEGAAVLLSNSEFTKRRVLDVYPQLRRIEACPLALPRTTAAGTGDADETFLSRIRPLSALIVGRTEKTERHKGHDLLLSHWTEVTARVPGAQLVVVGTGDDLDRLKSRAAELGVANDVLFSGWVSEATLRAVYDRVALYAMPSDGEGFGLVFLEAMAAALPCIASTTDASREIVADGETGYLVNPRDGRTAAARIADLLGSAALRGTFGEAGRARLRERFGYERFERDVRAALSPLLDVYEDAANENELAWRHRRQ